ncbi:MAG: helix-turn-helix domain-containing protein [Acidobacteriaceae bacterium]|nr:helix-turn-helix domain-containing protein [Acidobacteriaceae bacterium]
MDERIRFVIRLKDGETMASLCREYGILRKTCYKIFERYEECGLEGLTDRARRPTATPINYRYRWKRRS